MSTFIEIDGVPRDLMQAHFLASPPSAEEPRKHLTELNSFRNLDSEEAER